MRHQPKENGANGRDGHGRFIEGNPGGPGNPYVKRTAEIRATLLGTVSDDDLRAIVRALVRKAKKGDTIAAREVLDRLIGKAPALVQAEIAATTVERVLTPEEAVAAIRAEYEARHLDVKEAVALPGGREGENAS
jgi:hypothetical protein